MTIRSDLKTALETETGIRLVPLQETDAAGVHAISYMHPKLGLLLARLTLRGRGTAEIEVVNLELVESWERRWRSKPNRSARIHSICSVLRNPKGILVVRHEDAMRGQTRITDELATCRLRIQRLTQAIERLR